MVNPVSGTTSVLALLGHPVSHSISPFMHNTAIAACGLDYVYVPFAVLPEKLAEAVEGTRAMGIRGFNVTIPHKTAIIPMLDVLDESALQAGAVNTVKNDDGILTGYNTDGDGFVKSLRDDLSFDVRGADVLVIGAGGAARGAVAALCRHKAASVAVCNRTFARALEIENAFQGAVSGTSLRAVPLEDGTRWAEKADLVVNTTSVGLCGPGIIAVDISRCSSRTRVYDMLYYPPVTPLLELASSLGLPCANGEGMLASQGELAFMIWTGIHPPAGLMKKIIREYSGMRERNVSSGI